MFGGSPPSLGPPSASSGRLSRASQDVRVARFVAPGSSVPCNHDNASAQAALHVPLPVALRFFATTTTLRYGASSSASQVGTQLNALSPTSPSHSSSATATIASPSEIYLSDESAVLRCGSRMVGHWGPSSTARPSRTARPLPTTSADKTGRSRTPCTLEHAPRQEPPKLVGLL